MEMTELRSKEEVKQEIEATRRDTKRALREAKTAWVTENPAVLAWQRTRARAQQAKMTVAMKARSTDCQLRSKIYGWLGIAAAAGMLIGFFAKRKRTRTTIEDRCC